MDTKKCCTCKEAKPVNGFSNCKSKRDGLQSRCRACEKQHYQNNKEQIIKRCKKWRKDNKEAVKQYYQANKEAIADYRKQYRQDNKEAIKQYYQDNKEVMAAYMKKYQEANKDKINARFRKRYATNPALRAVISMRGRLRKALKGTAKAASTMELVGCDRDHLVFHLEQQFTEGMTWQNIHIDHIQPCAGFDLEDKEQQRVCFHYTNLQPLFAEDNLKKSDSDPGDHQVRLL